MKDYNISQITKYIVAGLSVALMLCIVVTIVSMKMLSGYIMQRETNSFQVEMSKLDDCLKEIETAMISEIAYSTDMEMLAQEEKTTRRVESVNAIKRMKLSISNWCMVFDLDARYYIYFPKNEIGITSSSGEAEYLEFYRVEDKLKEYILEQTKEESWRMLQLQNAWYLIRTVYYGDRIICCYVPVACLQTGWAEEYRNVQYCIQLQDGKNPNYVVMSGNEALKRENESPWERLFHLNVSNEYCLISGMTARLWMAGGALESMFLRQGLVIFLLIGSVCFTVMWLLKVHNKVVKPIQKFNYVMEQYERDEENVFDENAYYELKEMGNANRIMGDMVESIKNMKIRIYEQSLREQKVRQDFLTLQIEPHFYLNCLNIIYHMAQMGDYKEIQHLTNCVAEYMRYVMKSRDELVRVDQEMHHIGKYLEIQAIRYKDGFTWHADIEPEVREARIPPLIIQTFVENSLKHTIDWESEIELSITGMKSGTMAEICIEDTGEGFDPEILRKLQSRQNISEGEKRIGVMNAVDRLKLAFPDQAEVLFYNRAEGGAGVLIRFPLGEAESRKGDKEHDEYSIGGR